MSEKEMKALEKEWTLTLPTHGYKILRLDGRAFSTWTKKHCKKPFDMDFVDAMNCTAKALCAEIQGAQFAYTQSDEISVLITDLGDKEQQWFGGDVVKTVSVAASIATNAFNFWFEVNVHRLDDFAQFDARVFALPDRMAVERYFLQRQADAYTNAVSMLASAHFSPKQLHGVSTIERITMLMAKGVQVSSEPVGVYFGRLVIPESCEETVTFTHSKLGEMTQTVFRNRWRAKDADWFSWDTHSFLEVLIP